MNKKVSTLLTVALTLGGSLLSSSAFAEKVDSKQFTDALGKGLVLDVDALTKDGVIELTENVNLEGRHLEVEEGQYDPKRDLPFFIVKKPVTIKAENGKDVTIKGNIVVASDGVKILGLNLQTPSTVDRFGGTGSWYSSLVSVFADDVTIEGNSFDGNANRPNGFREAIVIYPQGAETNYDIKGNKFTNFTSVQSGAEQNAAIKINLASLNNTVSNHPQDGGDTFDYDAIMALDKKGIIDRKSGTGKVTTNPGDIDVEGLYENNTFGTGNSSNIIVLDGAIPGEKEYICHQLIIKILLKKFCELIKTLFIL